MGLNSKFKASQEFPMKMYYDDFDTNGSFETIVATEKSGVIINLGMDDLARTVQRYDQKEISIL
jgi:hypothetical protein